MAIVRSEGSEALSLEDMPVDESLPRAGGSGLLERLRAAWAIYQSENKRGWAELVKEQAKNPTLD